MINLNNTIWQFNDEIEISTYFSISKLGNTRPIILTMNTGDYWYGVKMDNDVTNSFGYLDNEGLLVSLYDETNGWSDDSYKIIKFVYEPDTFTSIIKADFIAWLQTNATELPSSYYITNNIELVSIADAIRAKANSNNNLDYPEDFISTINSFATDANATAADIIEGKTAYVGSNKITGTYTLSGHTTATANTADIRTNKTAWVNGVKITGSGGQVFCDECNTQLTTLLLKYTFSGQRTIRPRSELNITLTGTLPENAIIGKNNTYTSKLIYTASSINYSFTPSQYINFQIYAVHCNGYTVSADVNIRNTSYEYSTSFGSTGTNIIRLECYFNIPKGSVDTANATAISSDIKTGKTAYVNGTKITGTYTPSVTSIEYLTATLETEVIENDKIISSGDPALYNLISHPIPQPAGKIKFNNILSGTYNNIPLTSDEINNFAISLNYISPYGKVILSTVNDDFTIEAGKSLILNFDYYDVVIT